MNHYKNSITDDKIWFITSNYSNGSNYCTDRRATPSIATVEVEAASVNYYTIDNLNLRAGASPNFKVMVTIPKGKQVSYVSKSGSWSKVTYGSKTGYVSSKYLKSTEVATIPATK